MHRHSAESGLWVHSVRNQEKCCWFWCLINHKHTCRQCVKRKEVFPPSLRVKFSAKSYLKELNERPSILSSNRSTRTNTQTGSYSSNITGAFGYRTVKFSCFQTAVHSLGFLISQKACYDSSYRSRYFVKLHYYKTTFLEWRTRYGLLCFSKWWEVLGTGKVLY